MENQKITIEQELANLNFETNFSEQEKEAFNRKAERADIDFKKAKKSAQIRAILACLIGGVIIYLLLQFGSGGRLSQAFGVFFILIYMISSILSALRKEEVLASIQKQKTAIHRFVENNNLMFFRFLPSSKSGNSLFEQDSVMKLNVFFKGDYHFGVFERDIQRGDGIAAEEFFFIEKTLPFGVQTLVIDSKKSSIINLETAANKNLLSLEGNFHDYFEIETEVERKMEATAFLAPDLMNFLTANFGDCDFEFFDNTVRILFPKSNRDLSVGSNLIDEMSINLPRAMDFFEKFSDKFQLLKVDRLLAHEVKAEYTKEDVVWDAKRLGIAFITFGLAFFGMLIGILTKNGIFFLAPVVIGVGAVFLMEQNTPYQRRLQKARQQGGVRIHNWRRRILKPKHILLAVGTVALLVTPSILTAKNISDRRAQEKNELKIINEATKKDFEKVLTRIKDCSKDRWCSQDFMKYFDIQEEHQGKSVGIEIYSGPKLLEGTAFKKIIFYNGEYGDNYVEKYYSTESGHFVAAPWWTRYDRYSDWEFSFKKLKFGYIKKNSNTLHDYSTVWQNLSE